MSKNIANLRALVDLHMSRDSDKEAEIVGVAIDILEDALTDIKRIANALEKIAAGGIDEGRLVP